MSVEPERRGDERFDRTERLIGVDGLKRLKSCHVAIFGLGGVGAYCAEGLVRTGVGRIRLVDHDRIAVSNCNRQLEALGSTVGKFKVDVLAQRLQDINPELMVEASHQFFDLDAAEILLGGGVSVVVDAIDALGPKVDLLDQCRSRGIAVVTALGAAARLDPTRIRIAKLSDTKVDRLALQVRKRLRRRRPIDDIWAVYSEEPPFDTHESYQGPRTTDDLFRGRQRRIQPSAAMVPAAMGMSVASVVIRLVLGLPIT